MPDVDTGVVRPILKWAGGKRQLLPELRPFYPAQFTRYLEPFLGSGAVFLDLYNLGLLRGRTVVLSDINADIIGCYRAVRDEIRYDPYIDYTDPETYRASSVLAKGHGYCVGKASLYVALCRTVGIPARLGLADVKNHLATPRLLEMVGTEVFAYQYREPRPGDPSLAVGLAQALAFAVAASAIGRAWGRWMTRVQR